MTTLSGGANVTGMDYGNDYYSSETKLVKYSHKHLSDRQVLFTGLAIVPAQDNG